MPGLPALTANSVPLINASGTPAICVAGGCCAPPIGEEIPLCGTLAETSQFTGNSSVSIQFNHGWQSLSGVAPPPACKAGCEDNVPIALVFDKEGTLEGSNFVSIEYQSETFTCEGADLDLDYQFRASVSCVNDEFSLNVLVVTATVPGNWSTAYNYNLGGIPVVTLPTFSFGASYSLDYSRNVLIACFGPDFITPDGGPSLEEDALTIVYE